MGDQKPTPPAAPASDVKAAPAASAATPVKDAAKPSGADTTQKTSPDSAAKDPKSKDSKKKTTIIITAIIVFLLIAGGLTALFVTGVIVFNAVEEDAQEEDMDEEEDEDGDEDADDEDEEDEDDDDEDEQSSQGAPAPTLNTFNGEFVTGKYPDGWQIKEYKDGAGSSMLPGGGATITGLTGLEVLAPGSKMAFKIEAVSGIGGIAGCDNFFKFADTSQTYQDQKQFESDSVGITMTIVDLSGSVYAEFDLMGVATRRVAKKIYQDVTVGQGFDPGCGMQESFWNYQGLSFSIDGYDSWTYQPEVGSTLTAGELDTLDDILESLTVK